MVHCDNNDLKKELAYCLFLWQTQGYCTFGQKTHCLQCAAPYLLWKLLTGEVIHGSDLPRLTLMQWQEKFKQLTSS